MNVSSKYKPERQTLTVEEAGAILGLGRNSAYKAAGEQQIPTVRIGRRLLVPRAALNRLLESAGNLGQRGQEAGS